MNTNELTGTALDWAVAQAEGNVRLQYDSREGLIINNVLGWFAYRPSVAWQQGGPIIEREGIAIYLYGDSQWNAHVGGKEMVGPTPLVAAMRCYVASKLGDNIEVPKELL